MMQESTLWIGLLMGTLAALCLNLGKGIQKMKVKVLGQGRAMFSPEHRRDFRIWLFGALLTTSATGLFSVALKFTDKSSLVSALNGVGLLGLVFFAWLKLKEPMGIREWVGAGLVVIGTTVMGYMDQPLPQGQSYALASFLHILAILAAIFLPLALLALKKVRLHGLVFGAIVGTLIGIAMILGDMALVKAQGSLLGQLQNPYPYAALFCAASALALTQFAFWRATALAVVPTINSFIILVPVLVEYFTFGTVLQPAQYLAVLLIVLGVVLLTTAPRQEFA
jgi:drug/metabolite transporter (DMT)-like permease